MMDKSGEQIKFETALRAGSHEGDDEIDWGAVGKTRDAARRRLIGLARDFDGSVRKTLGDEAADRYAKALRDIWIG